MAWYRWQGISHERGVIPHHVLDRIRFDGFPKGKWLLAYRNHAPSLHMVEGVIYTFCQPFALSCWKPRFFLPEVLKIIPLFVGPSFDRCHGDSHENHLKNYLFKNRSFTSKVQITGSRGFLKVWLKWGHSSEVMMKGLKTILQNIALSPLGCHALQYSSQAPSRWASQHIPRLACFNIFKHTWLNSHRTLGMCRFVP